MDNLSTTTTAGSTTFSDFVERERTRLNEERGKINEQIGALNEQGEALDRELAAIEAYENAKVGKSARSNGRGRAARTNGNGKTRRGSKREEILAVVKANPKGVSRGEILEKMGLKGNKSGEMSVSNALTALVKNHQIDRNKSKKYVTAAA